MDNEPAVTRDVMVESFKMEYADVFSSESIGCCPIVEHEIVLTEGARP